MGFTNGNTNEIEVVLTFRGKDILARTGLQNLQLYCEFSDSEATYTLDVFPSLVADLKGKSNGVLGVPIKDKYKLK